MLGSVEFKVHTAICLAGKAVGEAAHLKQEDNSTIHGGQGKGQVPSLSGLTSSLVIRDTIPHYLVT